MSPIKGGIQNINLSTWSLLKVVLFILALVFLWFVRDILGILFVALLLASLISPFADAFAKFKIPRGLAVLIIYIVLFSVSATALLLIIPPVIEQVQQLIINFSAAYGDLASSFDKLQAVSAEYGFAENVKTSIETLQEQFGSSITNIFATISGFFGGVAAFVIILVLAFYMVVEEDSARRFVKSLAPAEYQPFLAQLFTKMQNKIGSWLRGQIILGLVVGTAVYIGLSILGVRYALVLGILSALFEIIPYAGPLLATIPGIIIGFAISPIKGIMVLILYIVIQQIENNILVPKIMQRVTGLNPIVSIVALLIGIKLGGMVGAILAIPVATMASVVLEELFSEFRTDNIA